MNLLGRGTPGSQRRVGPREGRETVDGPEGVDGRTQLGEMDSLDRCAPGSQGGVGEDLREGRRNGLIGRHRHHAGRGGPTARAAPLLEARPGPRGFREGDGGAACIVRDAG